MKDETFMFKNKNIKPLRKGISSFQFYDSKLREPKPTKLKGNLKTISNPKKEFKEKKILLLLTFDEVGRKVRRFSGKILEEFFWGSEPP